MDFRDARDIIATTPPKLPHNLPRAVRDAGIPAPTWTGSEAPALYFSPLRPFHGLRIPGLVPVLERWGCATAPLDADAVVKFELIPVGTALAWFLFDAANRLQRRIELTEVAMPDDGYHAAALFLNPRGLWQFSTFVDCIGPTGHNEGTDPIDLLDRGLHRYRFWNPGAVDNLIERLAECG